MVSHENLKSQHKTSDLTIYQKCLGTESISEISAKRIAGLKVTLQNRHVRQFYLHSLDVK